LLLSVEVYGQFQTLLTELETLHLGQNNDSWIYKWGSTMFISNKAYLHLLGSVIVSPVYKWLSKSTCL
jgi:hypothetical protein